MDHPLVDQSLLKPYQGRLLRVGHRAILLPRRPKLECLACQTRLPWLPNRRPPPPPPRSGDVGGASSGMQSQLTRQLAEAQDTHQLAAHQIVDELRENLDQIVNLAEKARYDLSNTVGQRTINMIIVLGPTWTGKSTVVPWEAMRWLEDHCAIRSTKAGQVICSQQRRKVTISLAKEVRRRHGEMGQTVVGYHVSKDLSASESTRLMYMTEAIGVHALLKNRETNPTHPVTIVVADESS